MTPYINPWFFYWISVAKSARFFLYAIGALSLVVAIIIIIPAAANAYDSEDLMDNLKNVKKQLTAAILISIFSAMIAAFLPTEASMYKMVVAKVITPDNIAGGVDTIKQVIDYIVQKIAELR